MEVAPAARHEGALTVLASAVAAPAKADARGRRLQRARRQAGGRLGQVVAGRRDVVWRVGVEQRRQVLVLAPPDAELELAAAVVADVALGAVGAGVEQVV